MYRILQCTAAHCSTAAAEQSVQCTVYSTVHPSPPSPSRERQPTDPDTGRSSVVYLHISTQPCTMLADTAAPDLAPAQEEEVGWLLCAAVLQC